MFSGNWPRLRGVALAAVALAIVPASVASAQELVHRFISPGFGGNPFNTDYLLGTANIHRPDEPAAPTDTPTEEELIARQIQARFLSNLSSDIIDRIQNAQPGDSGEFNVGDQVIRFSRTATETRITFVNGRTGETSEVVIPDRNAGAASAGVLSVGQSSAERALMGGQGLSTGTLSGVGGLQGLATEGSLEARLGGNPGL